MTKFAFFAADTPSARDAHDEAITMYGNTALFLADAVVVFGGDGYMLGSLQRHLAAMQSNPAIRRVPIFGVNHGTLGFLMNSRESSLVNLPDRIGAAVPVPMAPLRATVTTSDGQQHVAYAFNEVALRRSGSQAANLRVLVGGTERLACLSGDGLLLATPAGSAAYNYSAGGPVLPLSSHALALTGICPGRPARWPGAVLGHRSSVRVEVLQPDKRPVDLTADQRVVHDVLTMDVVSAPDMAITALFDAGLDLDERLAAVQFR